MLDLFKKYLENDLTPAEFEQLMKYFGQPERREDLVRLIREELESGTGEENALLVHQLVDRVERALPEQIRKRSLPQPMIHRKRIGLRKAVAIAASAALLISVALLWHYRQQDAEHTHQARLADIAPGKNRAILKLDGAAPIELDSLKLGLTVNHQAVYYKDGGLVVDLGEQEVQPADSEPKYAILLTPRGGQYQIVLPDGTKVWLNAASSLRYPVSFSGEQREVELNGEAYFEVAADPARPFTVTSGKQRLRVLGTKFNVSAYADEDAVVTTLVEGRVTVSSADTSLSRTLGAGQQAVLRDSGFSVNAVDVSTYTGWKEGRFTFNRLNIASVLRQIERWYDVDFVSEAPLRDVSLWGTLSRDVMLSELLQILEVNTGYKFKREGRRIIMRQ